MALRKKHRKNKNKWKRLFYGLLILNIVFFLLIISFIFWPVSETNISLNQDREEQESSEFIVRTSKQNLNELVNAYIDQLLSTTKHQYSISLDEDVHLTGELPVFTSSVPLSVHFEPFVQDNGDIILKQKSISVGLLQLPNQKIMEYMKKYLPMPEWVTVNPKDEEIYVAVTEMEIRSNFEVSVEHIDLEANNLAFKIKVPYKSLGIDLEKDVQRIQ